MNYSAGGDIVTKQEMTEIFSVMLLAWPNAEMFKGGVAKLGPTIELWTACLSDVDFWLGKQAVIRLCRECKFPPSIAEFKRQAESVNNDIQARINRAWNRMQISLLSEESLDEWYQSLDPRNDIKAVVDALGGVGKCAAGSKKGWSYNEFRDMYKKLMHKEKPGAVAQLPEKRRS